MRVSSLWLCLLIVAAGVWQTARSEDARRAGRSYGLERRTPWTTSRVVGSPDPPPPYRTKKYFPKLKVFQPIYLAAEPGTQNMLLIQHLGNWSGPGRLLRIANDPNVEQPETLLAMDRLIYGLTCHPDFVSNGYVYLVTNGPVTAKNKQNRISRFTIDRKAPYGCDPKSEVIYLEWDSNGHNGGELAFGPDGYFYAPTGDGTSDSDTNNTGQTLDDLYSAMLRIDVDHPDGDKPYSIPKDNPFLQTPGARPEIWAYGFRNPWRVTYDWKSNQLWVGQNGQDLWEQVYLVERGANYGWSVTEGSHPFQLERKRGPTPIVPPTVEHPHSESRSLTGGVVYRGNKLPELEGTYVYGDFSTGHIWGVRHDGHQVTWKGELARTTMQIVGFCVDQHGELLVVDQGSGIYKLEPSPPDTNSGKFPTRLSETGLFTSVAGHKTDPALIPYSVNAPLWSDQAFKERFIALPGETQIDFNTNRGWNFPEGTVLVKTFSLDMEAGKPASRRRIETRLLTRQQNEWVGYSYLWNDQQTDATLVASAGADREFTIGDTDAAGGSRKQTWHYPSRTECMVCHSRAANFVLGLTTVQMNKVHDYDGFADNQLRAMEHIGAFRINWLEYDRFVHDRWQRLNNAAANLLDECFAGMDVSLGTGKAAKTPSKRPRKATYYAGVAHSVLDPFLPDHWKLTQRLYREGRKWSTDKLRKEIRYGTYLPQPIEEYAHLVDPYDASQDLSARARAYLHANCSICHVAAGGGNALMELEYSDNRAKSRIFDVDPQHSKFGLSDAKIVALGNPDRSVLLHRMAIRGNGQMPPLATSLVDTAAVQLLRDWIAQLKPEKEIKPPVKTASAEELESQKSALRRKLKPYYQPPAEYADKYESYTSPLLFADGTRAKSPEDWRRRRQEIAAKWNARLGAWPPLVERPTVERLESVEQEGYTQQHVHVQISQDGKWVDGYLLVPAGTGPFPAVLVPFYEPLTSIGQGKKGQGTHDYGLQLVKRGFVTLSIGTPDSQNKFGDDTRAALTQAGIDQRRQPLTLLAYVAANCHTALAQMPQVDPERIGVIGLSYGGKWSMFASTLYEKFACAVWSDPGIVFNEKNSNVNYWEPWYLGYDPNVKRKPGVPSQDNPRTGLYKEMVEHGENLVDLHALMAPRPVLVSGGTEDRPQNWRALNHLIAVDKMLGYSGRVAMTARPTHVPTAEALELELAFLEYWLKCQ